nr:MAG TPA: RRN7 Zinc-finger of RNA-polymerase I-specific TFIIB, Rrn7 [Caudoviricetes sp.]
MIDGDSQQQAAAGTHEQPDMTAELGLADICGTCGGCGEVEDGSGTYPCPSCKQ